ncbi:hypothetical protein [Millisia brevis]|uniref:hypothetical protein n=1 Tax=Millisia brevis TaxID=264148 RepID=UPI0012EE5537|nr:hypothetical protein [Millisia brevis]
MTPQSDAAGRRVYKVREVFVPGGRPTVTYIPRGDNRLEAKIEDYLDTRHKILSVSGPTKTGKTVLLKSQIPDDLEPIWLSGGAISSIDEFWSNLADELDVPTETALDGGLSATDTSDKSGELNVTVAKGAVASSDSVTRDRRISKRTVITPKRGSRNALKEDLERVIVIDDFHYIPSDVQLDIIRGLKDLVFDGIGLVVAAVPHRAYDVMKVEKEMTGRVAQLEVGFWDDTDLEQIAVRGFRALNVSVGDSVIRRFRAEAFRSPHLMQDFCRQLCRMNSISVSRDELQSIEEPNWDAFFSQLAPGTSKATFDRLARGPRERSDRKTRVLRSGAATDIYGVVLSAIAHTGPLTEITYEQLRAAIRAILAASDDPPQKHEVTRVLDQMTRIAREDIEGEPVVEYDNALATLYISDPYFAYWLRWGAKPADNAD